MRARGGQVSGSAALNDKFQASGKFQAELRLYLEVVGTQADPPPADAAAPEDEGWPMLPAQQLLLFIKFYEPRTEQLSFVGTHVASQSHTLTDLLPVLRASKGLPPNQELAVYEEVEFESSVRFEARPTMYSTSRGHCLRMSNTYPV